MPALKNPRNELLAQGLARGLDFQVAARKATGGRKIPVGIANQMANRPDVVARVSELLDMAAAKTGITVERIMLEMGRIAFADPRRAVKWGTISVIGDGVVGDRQDVELIDSEEIDEDTARSIASVSKTKDGVKVTFHDKGKALEMLGKTSKMFTEKIELGGSIDVGDQLRDRLNSVREMRRKTIDHIPAEEEEAADGAD